MIKGISVDPYLKMITEVEIEGGLKSLQESIGDHFIEAVYIDDDNVMYVDSEGLFRENQQFFVYDGKIPLAGKAIIVGANMEDGTDVSTKSCVTDIMKKIEFLSVAEIAARRIGG